MVDPDKFCIRRGVEYIVKYWATYPLENNLQDYTLDTFLHDSLYGLGRSLDEQKYQGVAGYKKFQNDLLAELTQRKLRGKF